MSEISRTGRLVGTVNIYMMNCMRLYRQPYNYFPGEYNTFSLFDDESVRIVVNNGLVTSIHQDIFWTNDDRVHWSIYAWPALFKVHRSRGSVTTKSDTSQLDDIVFSTRAIELWYDWFSFNSAHVSTTLHQNCQAILFDMDIQSCRLRYVLWRHIVYANHQRVDGSKCM